MSMCFRLFEREKVRIGDKVRVRASHGVKCQPHSGHQILLFSVSNGIHLVHQGTDRNLVKS